MMNAASIVAGAPDALHCAAAGYLRAGLITTATAAKMLDACAFGGLIIQTVVYWSPPLPIPCTINGKGRMLRTYIFNTIYYCRGYHQFFSFFLVQGSRRVSPGWGAFRYSGLPSWCRDERCNLKRQSSLACAVPPSKEVFLFLGSLLTPPVASSTLPLLRPVFSWW